MDDTSLAWLSWGLGIDTILQVVEKGPTCFIFLLVWVLFFISSKNLVKVELLAVCSIPGLELEAPLCPGLCVSSVSLAGVSLKPLQ